MRVQAYITATDVKTGKQIFRTEAHSFLAQFIQIVTRFLLVNRTQACIQTNGVPYSLTGVGQMNVDAGAGIDTFGLLIGSSATPVTIDDYFLKAQITNAQVSHGITSVSLVTENGGLSQWTVTVARIFTNLAVLRTIRELALICNFTGAFFTIDRSLVPDYPLDPLAVVAYAYNITISI